jgi:hypothetical protein
MDGQPDYYKKWTDLTFTAISRTIGGFVATLVYVLVWLYPDSSVPEPAYQN